MRSRFVIAASFGVVLTCCGLTIEGLGTTPSLDGGDVQAPDATTPIETDGKSPPVESGTPEGDATTPHVDATVPPPDAGKDTGAVTMFDCPGGQPVTDCSACAGNPLECTLCGGSGPRTFCTTGRICNTSQTVSNWCPCAGSDQPAKCPSPHQTCYDRNGDGICLTCGEQNETDGYMCKNGQTCDRNSYKCQ